jgi:hypothetical protein
MAVKSDPIRGPRSTPIGPKAANPPKRVRKTRRGWSCIRPFARSGRTRLSTGPITKRPQPARNKPASGRPVRARSAAAGSQTNPVPRSGTKEKKAIIAAQITGWGSPTRTKPTAPRTPCASAVTALT